MVAPGVMDARPRWRHLRIEVFVLGGAARTVPPADQPTFVYYHSSAALTFELATSNGETMESTESWRSLFEDWPSSIPRDGTVVTTYGDAVPFSNFLISGGLLLLERARPDAAGNRKVMISYGAIAAVNLSTGAELSQFQSMGFQPPL